MNCQVCKRKESHQFSSMCQDCIDRGWRAKGKDGGYYNVEYKKQRHKDFINISKTKENE